MKDSGWFWVLIAIILLVVAVPSGLFTFLFLGLTSKTIFTILLILAIIYIVVEARK